MVAKYAVIPEKEKCEIRLEELTPESLAPNELLVRADYSMISAGTELAGFCALSPGVYQKGAWNAYPWRPGYGLSGKIIAAGSQATRFKESDRVFCFGKHASLQIFQLDRSGTAPTLSAFKEDQRLDSRTITASRMGLVSLTALQISGVRPGDTVSIFGLGMVGNLAAQLYQVMGARVIGFDTIPMRCEIAGNVGIQETVCVAPQEQLKVLLEMTDGKGADITVDAVGSSAVISTCVKCTATYGKIVLLGTPRVAVEGNLTEVLRPVHMKCLQMLGAFEWRLQPYPGIGINNSIQSNLQMLWKLIYEGKLKVIELISHVIKPEEMQSAYFGLLNDKDHYLGVLVDWRD